MRLGMAALGAGAALLLLGHCSGNETEPPRARPTEGTDDTGDQGGAETTQIPSTTTGDEGQPEPVPVNPW
jgi:hypothetical protein